jgi:hypothetical protein
MCRVTRLINKKSIKLKMSVYLVRTTRQYSHDTSGLGRDLTVESSH